MAPDMHEKLIFLIGSPRSGSTLLQRMIGSHSAIFTHPEPHLITPLAYLGYHDTVDAAPYDHINAAAAFRELVAELPRGEEDYLDALRAYADTLYGRLTEAAGAAYFLDKTPAYGLVLPFLTKLYPRARYVVLTRHPFAILHSVAHSFFAGDYHQAQEFNPIVQRYVPAVGALLRERPVDCVHVRYEDVVQDPEASMRRILEHLGLPFEPGCVEYGQQQHITKSFGDPHSVERHTRPVTDSLDKWAQDFLAQPDVLALAQQIASELDPADLEAWGFPKDSLFAALEGQAAHKTAGRLNTYAIKRKVLLGLRKNMHSTALGDAVRKVRYYCDVLLRT
jgi:hypothetical protein